MVSSSNLSRCLQGGILLSLLYASVATALTEFSADLNYYDRNDSVVATGRLYVTDDLSREERSQGERQEVRITNLFRGVTTLYDPATGEYQLTGEMEVVPRNPVRFCAETPLLACGYQQHEQIAGRSVERWGAELGFMGVNLKVIAWYDPELHYPLRVALESGGYQELSNVEVGRLPSALFTLPFGAVEVDRVVGVEIDYFSISP